MQGESDILFFSSANPGNEHVVGQKLIKPPEDAEEAPVGQGLTFDCFKVPEEPPEEAAEDADPDNPPPPKPPRLPSPLVVDNVMREPKIKFFGIPKLGAYVAIPFSMLSVDHETGLEIVTDEATGESIKRMNKITTPFVIGMDTIGKYRSFTVSYSMHYIYACIHLLCRIKI